MTQIRHLGLLFCLAASMGFPGCRRKGEREIEMSAAERGFAERAYRAYFTPHDDLICVEAKLDLPPDRSFVMRSVQIANVGDADIDAVWVFTNEQINLYSPLTMMAGVPSSDADAAAERILEIRKRYSHHHPPATVWGYPHHPAPLFGALGYGICDDIAAAAEVLARCRGLDMHMCSLHAGTLGNQDLPKPLDHVVNLLKVNDSTLPMDFDTGLVWRTREGRLASLSDMAENRAVPGPKLRDWVHCGHDAGEIMKAELAANQVQLEAIPPGDPWHADMSPFRMRLYLPVGARLTWLWSPVCPPYSDRTPPRPPYPPNYTNARLEWDLDPRSASVLSTDGALIALAQSPYPMLRGSLTLGAETRTKAYYCNRFLEYPKSLPRSLTWRALPLPPPESQSIDLKPIFCDGDRLKRNITLGSLVKAHATTSAKLEIVLQSSVAAQPTLRPGHNLVHIFATRPVAPGPFTVHTTQGQGGLQACLRSAHLEITFSCASDF